jgi:hypothetical protein
MPTVSNLYDPYNYYNPYSAVSYGWAPWRRQWYWHRPMYATYPFTNPYRYPARYPYRMPYGNILQ